MRRGTRRRRARSGSIDATARRATTNSFGTNDGVRKVPSWSAFSLGF